MRRMAERARRGSVGRLKRALVSPAADVGRLKTGSGVCACVLAAPGASQHSSAPSVHSNLILDISFLTGHFLYFAWLRVFFPPLCFLSSLNFNLMLRGSCAKQHAAMRTLSTGRRRGWDVLLGGDEAVV